MVLKQLIFMYFSWKWVILGQTYPFKNKELLTITGSSDTLLYSSISWNSVQNLKANGQALLVLALGEHGTIWFLLISLPVHYQNCWHFSFNLARNTYSFYWYYIFSFECSWLFSLKISMQKEKTHVILKVLVNMAKEKWENEKLEQN